MKKTDRQTDRQTSRHYNVAMRKSVSDKVISIARLERRNVVCSLFCMIQDRNGPIVLVLSCS